MAVGSDSLERNFGLVIAFLLPGFVCLAGAARFSPTIAGWMSLAPTSDPTVVGFLYVLLASIGAGLVASAVRWAIIDTVHHRTGLPPANLDFSRLQANLDAFQMAVEHNYRHYQFYALCRIPHKAYYADFGIMRSSGRLSCEIPFTVSFCRTTPPW